MVEVYCGLKGKLTSLSDNYHGNTILKSTIYTRNMGTQKPNNPYYIKITFRKSGDVRYITIPKWLVWGFTTVFLLGIAFFILSHYPDSTFKSNIAECKGMNDVNLIAEGHLKAPNKNNLKFGDKLPSRDGVYPPEPIYVLKGRFAYKGIKTGKTLRTNFSYVIREGHAPKNAFGKRALICLEGRTSRGTLKAIYIAK